MKTEIHLVTHSVTLEAVRARGEELLEMKEFLGHGNYQEWLKRNFEGGVSTARVYTRISKNWKWIESKINDRTTIEQALKLIKMK